MTTTPLSGQPDILGGLSPETEAVLQSTVEHEYGVFLGLVAKSRNKTPADIDKIAQGRVWTGGAARQLGLVDQFGDLDDAIAFAAKQAKLKQGGWHAKYLGSGPNPYASVIERMLGRDTQALHRARGQDLFAHFALQQDERTGRVVQDMRAARPARARRPLPRMPGAAGEAGWKADGRAFRAAELAQGA